MSKASNLLGNRYGSLIVMQRTENNKHGKTMWKCRCECGNVSIVSAGNLKSGKTKRCMKCAHKEASRKNRKPHRGTRLNRIYFGMRNRCENPNNYSYRYYGGRGIKVCDEWVGENGFEKFYEWSMLNGYNDDMSIERNDVNGMYSPDNCKWIPLRDQAKNTTKCKFYYLDGDKLTMKDVSRKYGINYSTLYSRLKNGMPIEVAIKKEVVAK